MVASTIVSGRFTTEINLSGAISVTYLTVKILAIEIVFLVRDVRNTRKKLPEASEEMKSLGSAVLC